MVMIEKENINRNYNIPLFSELFFQVPHIVVAFLPGVFEELQVEIKNRSKSYFDPYPTSKQHQFTVLQFVVVNNKHSANKNL